MKNLHASPAQNVRLVSWNVNGLSSKLPETGFTEYLYSFDICCLTETFSSPTFDFSVYFDGYEILHSPGIKLSFQGRCCGGVAVLVKKSLAVFINELICKDNFVAFRFCSPAFGDNVIICVYIPPMESPYYANRSNDCSFNILEDWILTAQEQYPRANIVICGDLNARIGQWDIHAEDELDTTDHCLDCSALFQLPRVSCDCTHFRERRSRDKTVNNFGKLLQNLCKIYHVLILNGCTPGDKEGNYTFVSAQGESVVDYCMMITNELNYQVDLVVASRAESDHMPIELHLSTGRYRKKVSN